MYGTDYEYASSRLNGTIIRKGKRPYLVREVSRDGTAHVETIINGNSREFKLSELDVSTPELGMVNCGRGRVCYLARVPRRDDWRQGLRKRTVSVLGGEKVKVDNKLIYKAILGRYPSLSEAISDSMDEGAHIAFHRHWSLYYRNDVLELHYKWYGKAGTMSSDCQDIKLVSTNKYQFEHLIQALREVLYECK